MQGGGQALLQKRKDGQGGCSALAGYTASGRKAMDSSQDTVSREDFPISFILLL